MALARRERKIIARATGTSREEVLELVHMNMNNSGENGSPENPWVVPQIKEEKPAKEVVYVTVARVGEVAPGRMKLVRGKYRPVVLAQVEGSYYAFEPFCPHQRAPLHEGTLYGHMVDCPRHHYTFDLRTGENGYPKNVFPPDLAAHLPRLRTYAVKVVDEEIQVAFPKPEDK